MSRLSDTERNGCKKLLRLLSADDVLALNDTVTNRMIMVESTKEAIEAIVTYSQDAEELLKRKKVHRDVIFKYLVKEGVVIPPNSEKHQLVKRTLELWSTGKVIQRPASENKVTVGDGLSDHMALGKQFCQWFFHLLNSQNPTLGQPPQEWGPQHFWEDVRLRVLSSAGEQQVEEFLGAELVSLRLLALAGQERLLFNPNLEAHGLKCMASPHGLVLVAVAGTVHRENACLGIFEGVFGIIRSPLDKNSWKIKFVHLKIRPQNALQEGEELGSPALTYDTHELQLLCSSESP